MNHGAVLRWPEMRGEGHRRLVAVLRKKIVDGVCTQESLARATGMHQTTISGILKKDKGTFDLDEAAAALEHVGLSLADFVTKAPATPKRTTTVYDTIVNGLKKRDEITPLVVALLGVPRTRLTAVSELVLMAVRAASGPRGEGTNG